MKELLYKMRGTKEDLLTRTIRKSKADYSYILDLLRGLREEHFLEVLSFFFCDDLPNVY